MGFQGNAPAELSEHVYGIRPGSDYIACPHGPDLSSPLKPVKNGVFSQYWMMYFIVVKLFKDQTVWFIIVYYQLGLQWEIIWVLWIEESCMSFDICIISCDSVCNQYFQFIRTVRFIKKGELVSYLYYGYGRMNYYCFVFFRFLVFTGFAFFDGGTGSFTCFVTITGSSKGDTGSSLTTGKVWTAEAIKWLYTGSGISAIFRNSS